MIIITQLAAKELDEGSTRLKWHRFYVHSGLMLMSNVNALAIQVSRHKR